VPKLNHVLSKKTTLKIKYYMKYYERGILGLATISKGTRKQTLIADKIKMFYKYKINEL